MGKGRDRKMERHRVKLQGKEKVSREWKQAMAETRGESRQSKRKREKDAQPQGLSETRR